MKSSFQICQIELRQNAWHFILVAAIALLLGTSIGFSIKAEHQISELASSDSWNADLVVLPKGVTLQDFKQEILNGTTTNFLPEAIFDTTLEMSKGQLNLGALLPITDNKGTRILVKGNNLNMGLEWLHGRQTVVPWEPQTIYGTPEWNNKVIAGFFATGSPQAMKSLKDLIDKRTVAQAILIRQQQLHDQANQQDLERALFIYSGILFSLIFLSLISLFLWLKVRLTNTLSVLTEIGAAKNSLAGILSFLLIALILIPALGGYLMSVSL